MVPAGTDEAHDRSHIHRADLHAADGKRNVLAVDADDLQLLRRKRPLFQPAGDEHHPADVSLISVSWEGLPQYQQHLLAPSRRGCPSSFRRDSSSAARRAASSCLPACAPAPAA